MKNASVNNKLKKFNINLIKWWFYLVIEAKPKEKLQLFGS